MINGGIYQEGNGGMTRHNSFTILDPASGIPSDESFYSFSKTPRMASVTSRHSFEKIPSFGGTTNMASALAAFTGGVACPSGFTSMGNSTIASAKASKRSELYSVAPLAHFPSTNIPASCTTVNNHMGANNASTQFLSTVKFHTPQAVQISFKDKRCDCYGMPKICNKVC